MSDNIDTFDLVGENIYDEDGEFIVRWDATNEDTLEIPDNAHDFRPIVDVEGEEVELHENVAVDWKEDPLAVMDQVNRCLELMGVEVRFIHIDRGDDAYHFGTESNI